MKNLVVLTGAGMSAESGISTFRDAGGLWDQYPVEQVATPEGYAANPKLVIDFYNERRKQLLAVKPNRGHELVSEMEKFFNVTVITQNIDNLHERAGSSHIIHLHGELTKVTSSWQPNNPAYITELKPEEYEIHLGDLAGDGSQFRPFIVWFGESVPTDSSKVKVNYKGTLIDGTQFDSSYDRKEPTTFRANQVIKGWTEALTMMPVGSKWELYIPQDLAYGAREAGQIKPFSTLIFEVELVGIEK